MNSPPWHSMRYNLPPPLLQPQITDNNMLKKVGRFELLSKLISSSLVFNLEKHLRIPGVICLESVCCCCCCCCSKIVIFCYISRKKRWSGLNSKRRSGNSRISRERRGNVSVKKLINLAWVGWAPEVVRLLGCRHLSDNRLSLSWTLPGRLFRFVWVRSEMVRDLGHLFDCSNERLKGKEGREGDEEPFPTGLCPYPVRLPVWNKLRYQGKWMRKFSIYDVCDEKARYFDNPNFPESLIPFLHCTECVCIVPYLIV